MVHGAEEIIFMGCEIAMKINLYWISAPVNGGENHLCYFHGVDQKAGLHHEFLKRDIHGTESQHNHFFMAFSWNFNKRWFHSAISLRKLSLFLAIIMVYLLCPLLDFHAMPKFWSN